MSVNTHALTVDRDLLKRAKAIAAKAETSINDLLTG